MVGCWAARRAVPLGRRQGVLTHQGQQAGVVKHAVIVQQIHQSCRLCPCRLRAACFGVVCGGGHQPRLINFASASSFSARLIAADLTDLADFTSFAGLAFAAASLWATRSRLFSPSIRVVVARS